MRLFPSARFFAILQFGILAFIGGVITAKHEVEIKAAANRCPWLNKGVKPPECCPDGKCCPDGACCPKQVKGCCKAKAEAEGVETPSKCECLYCQCANGDACVCTTSICKTLGCKCGKSRTPKCCCLTNCKCLEGYPCECGLCACARCPGKTTKKP